jgi:hypothetical protein
MSMVFFTNVPDLPAVEAESACEDFFYVTCPECQQLTAVSRYARDGQMEECCPPCRGQFWFYAGAFADQRRRL